MEKKSFTESSTLLALLLIVSTKANFINIIEQVFGDRVVKAILAWQYGLDLSD